ncbi:MAG: SDR family NAD(P)-dependent oxidoreductase, partial [Arenicellales bacterium]|nr:SDR family NAD(P)-dependent oxidoreductase [Arenicellales bacterium]
MGGVKGRVALVTGAGSSEGIGFATARLLKAAGARVAITSTTDRINKRCDALGGIEAGVFAQTADLTDSTAVNMLVEQIERILDL